MSGPTTPQVNYTPQTWVEQIAAVQRSAAADQVGRLPGATALARSSRRRIGCVALNSSNGSIVVDLPFPIPDLTIPLPLDIIPDGSLVQACIDVCFGGFAGLIPQGACVTVKFLGDDVVHECIGDCS